jgi:mRNA interferase RelE/StbE
MRYHIEMARRARKFLASESNDIQKQIGRQIDLLEQNPRPDGCKRLQGKRDLYRVRCGDYRIIYTIRDQQLLVLVVQIGHRRDVYRNL